MEGFHRASHILGSYTISQTKMENVATLSLTKQDSFNNVASCVPVAIFVESRNLQDEASEVSWQTSLHLPIHRTSNKDCLCTNLLDSTCFTPMDRLQHKSWQS